MIDNLENRVEKLEEGMGQMRVDSASSTSLLAQLRETLKDLGSSFREISATNVEMKTTMQSLQREIERGNKSQEIINKKIDTLASFSADMEKMRGSILLLEQTEKNDIEKLGDEISLMKADQTKLETKLENHLKEFENHKDDSKLDVIKLLKDGAGWLLSVVLGLALIWSLFGQNIRTP